MGRQLDIPLGGRQMSVQKVTKLMKDNGIKFVDLRFTFGKKTIGFAF